MMRWIGLTKKSWKRSKGARRALVAPVVVFELTPVPPVLCEVEAVIVAPTEVAWELIVEGPKLVAGLVGDNEPSCLSPCSLPSFDLPLGVSAVVGGGGREVEDSLPLLRVSGGDTALGVESEASTFIPAWGA